MRDGNWGNPLPSRPVFIPKSQTSKRNPLSIPSITDRAVQAAVRIELESDSQADMCCALSVSLKRSLYDALLMLTEA